MSWLRRLFGGKNSGSRKGTDESTNAPGKEPRPEEQIEQAMHGLPSGDPDAVLLALDGVASLWGVPDSHLLRGSFQEIRQAVIEEFATHQKQGEELVYFYLAEHAQGQPQGVMHYQAGQGHHFIGRLGPDSFAFLIHQKYYGDLPKISRT